MAKFPESEEYLNRPFRERHIRNKKIAAGIGLALTLTGTIALANAEINYGNLHDSNQGGDFKKDLKMAYENEEKTDAFTLVSGIFTIIIISSGLRDLRKNKVNGF
jgi:hypothetical protein